MRILFLTNYYPPLEVGGYEQLCRDVAVRMADRGHAVHILTSTHRAASLPTPEPEVSRLLTLMPDYARKTGVAFEYFVHRKRMEAANLAVFQRAVDAFGPDVVFIWNLERLPRTLAAAAERLPETAVAYWLAGYFPLAPDEYWTYWHHPPDSWLRALIKAPLKRLALPSRRAKQRVQDLQMTHTAVVSQYMRRRGLAEGCLPCDAQVVYNGIELDAFVQPLPAHPTSGPLRLLQAGRMGPDKGCHTTLEAARLLRDEHGRADWHLTFVGDGPTAYVQQLKAFCRDAGLGEQVTFTGWVPRADMPDIMRRADVLLLPSIYPEALARVTLEAMAAGLAVVGTLAGGTGEIVRNGETGLTFTAGNANECAAQLNALITNPERRLALAKAGQRLAVSRFSLDEMVDKLEALVTTAVAEQVHAAVPARGI